MAVIASGDPATARSLGPVRRDERGGVDLEAPSPVRRDIAGGQKRGNIVGMSPSKQKAAAFLIAGSRSLGAYRIQNDP